MQLSIIVVSYNTADLTVATLSSVFEQLKKGSDWNTTNSEILVVDNHSTDNSVDQIKKFFTTHQIEHYVMVNRDNAGFAKANNQAIRRAKGDWLFLLNSDTLLKPKCLDFLAAAAQNKPAGLSLISPKLLNTDGSFQKTGGNLPSLLSLITQFWFLDDLPLVGKYLPSIQKKEISQDRIVYHEWLPGTALLIHRSVVDRIGDLDEDLFMYVEDIDLGWRAQKAGFRSAVITQAELIHIQSASSNKAQAYLGEFKGLLPVCQKMLPSWQQPLVRFVLKTGARLRILIFGTIKHDQNKADIYREILNQI